jgi:hypothetical protein
MLTGIGTAADWLSWSKNLQSLRYIKARRAESDRAHSLTEPTRFTFLWTATNALFCRSSILALLDPTSGSKKSELDRFRILFASSNLPAAEVGKSTATLLSMPMHVKHFPWPSVNSPPTLLEVIYFKYMVSEEQNRGIGKRIKQAFTTGNYSQLDLPSLIYATRNWNVHGVLLSSSFRGTRKKFDIWIDTVVLSLCRILEGSSAKIIAAI